jgi:hypothetical protein
VLLPMIASNKPRVAAPDIGDAIVALLPQQR